MTPQERKRQYRAYRLAARKLYQKNDISVPESSTVSMIDGGAFVDMIVWIPQSVLTSTIYDEVLRIERTRKEH